MGFIVLLIILLYVIAMTIGNVGIRLFLLSLAGLLLITGIGLSLSYAQNYLYDYTQFLASYGGLYTMLLIVGATALIGLLIWFIYFVFTTFAKIKIGNTDMDMDDIRR
jgi:hypothetical protein